MLLVPLMNIYLSQYFNILTKIILQVKKQLEYKFQGYSLNIADSLLIELLAKMDHYYARPWLIMLMKKYPEMKWKRH